jgi:hypothetical protein
VLRECWEDSQRVGNQRLVELNAVRAHADNVWFWQGDGADHPQSLSCPVVMTAHTLRTIIARAAAAETQLAECRAAWARVGEVLADEGCSCGEAEGAENHEDACLGHRIERAWNAVKKSP